MNDRRTGIIKVQYTTVTQTESKGLSGFDSTSVIGWGMFSLLKNVYGSKKPISLFRPMFFVLSLKIHFSSESLLSSVFLNPDCSNTTLISSTLWFSDEKWPATGWDCILCFMVHERWLLRRERNSRHVSPI